jgi:hypothetical protein
LAALYDSHAKPAFVLMKKYIERPALEKQFVYQSIGS